MKRNKNIWLLPLAVLTITLASCSSSGSMYYTVSGSTITVHNTPGGTMKAELDYPPGASGGRKSLYVLDGSGKMTGDTIDIEYDRTGVKSVTMKGVQIPRKE